MKALKWNIVHEMDNPDGSPTCWATEVNHPSYGKYIWVTESENGYDVEFDAGEAGFRTLKPFKTVIGAKRWVTKNVKQEG